MSAHYFGVTGNSKADILKAIEVLADYITTSNAPA
jgi:hypothetical protein